MLLSWKSSLQICTMLIIFAVAGMYWFLNVKAQEARLTFLSAQLEYDQSVGRLNAAVLSNADALLEVLLSDAAEICFPNADDVVDKAVRVEQSVFALQNTARDAYRYESALPLSDVRLLMQYTDTLSSIVGLLEATRSIRDVYQEDTDVCFRRTPPGVPV